MQQVSPKSLAINIRIKMSTPSQPYTLTLSTPSQGTPGFLRHLQQSDSNPPWLGEIESFSRKHNPSTWPWQHAMLNAGHNLKLPARCSTVQTWKFEIEADEPFVADLEMPAEPPHDLKTCACHSNLIIPKRRFCALHFVAFRTAEAEQKYKQQLATAVDQLDMCIQITGRILESKENLGAYAKVPALKASKKKNYIKASLDEFLARADERARAKASEPPATPVFSPPASTFFALMSFPSSSEHEDFMARTKHGWDEDGVVEEIITTNHLVLPPKSQPISTMDWSYGNPHEPYGQDWFG
jgi:hypothetical protein